MDFTIKKYKELLLCLKRNDYEFQTFNEFLISPLRRVIILRHDVDLLPQNSLNFAKIQSEMGIKGTYYFRAVPESWDEKIIKEISQLGHEIGYHYETMDTSSGDIDKAWNQFKDHLSQLREIAEVTTICMHGSPRSKFDNKDVWHKYDYKTLDLIGEPYYDVDFDKVYYLTDTGRMWDGHKFSVRDKVDTLYKQSYHSTPQIIDAVDSNELPSQIMFTFHPQRWHESYNQWMIEMVSQSAKNLIKRYFFVK